MSLSISKLEAMLSNYQLTITAFYSMDSLCVYLHLLAVDSARPLLLYIPSNYSIDVPEGDRRPNFRLRDIRLDSSTDTVTEEYLQNRPAEAPDTENIHLEDSGEELQKTLEHGYNRPVILEEQVKNELNSIFRQLKRIRIPLRDIPYKACILSNSHLCCIRRNNELEGFHIREMAENKTKQLVVSIDLEKLFTRRATLNQDLEHVYTSIGQVLERNQHKNSRLLERLLARKEALIANTQLVQQSQGQLKIYQTGFQTLLQRLLHSEKLLHKQLIRLKHNYARRSELGGTHKAMQLDAEKSHQTGLIERQLAEINSIKQEVYMELSQIYTNQLSMALNADRTYFDTTVLLDSVLNTLSKSVL
jgi:hypothetical protein